MRISSSTASTSRKNEERPGPLIEEFENHAKSPLRHRRDAEKAQPPPRAGLPLQAGAWGWRTAPGAPGGSCAQGSTRPVRVSSGSGRFSLRARLRRAQPGLWRFAGAIGGCAIVEHGEDRYLQAVEGDAHDGLTRRRLRHSQKHELPSWSRCARPRRRRPGDDRVPTAHHSPAHRRGLRAAHGGRGAAILWCGARRVIDNTLAKELAES